MLLSAVVILAEFLVLNLGTVKARCPQTFPIEINGHCYILKTDGMKFKDAKDTCKNMGGKITSVKSEAVLQKIESVIEDFVNEKLKNAKFWIGFVMKDTSMSKAKEDRLWDWEYDKSQLVQKDYNLWEEKGGPTKAGLSCAAIDGANDFMVKPLDCAGSRLPIICMMKEGKTCKHDVAPYLMYGKYCVAVLKYADAYGKVAPGCEPEAPTPYLEEMKDSVSMASKNSFLGAGLYMHMQKDGDKFLDLDTGKEPDEDMWEEGEPRGEYDCVGLSVQTNNKLKLKTISCDFFSAYICIEDKSS